MPIERAVHVNCYQLYRAQIEHEDVLLNQRITWIVTSQAFLLGTYVFTTNAPAFYLPPANVCAELPGVESVLFDLGQFVQTIALLRGVFKVVGLFSSLATCVSSIAAVLAIARLTKKYGANVIALDETKDPCVILKEYGTDEMARRIRLLHERGGIPPLVTRRRYRIMGLAASIFFSVVFAGAWAILMLPPGLVVNAMPLVAVSVVVLVGVVIFLVFRLSDWTAS